MDELKNIAPKLSKLKKETPFRTPDNYFDDFSARLQIKLEAEKKVVPKQKSVVLRFLKPAIGLAASFAIIFMLVYWPLKTFMPSEVVETEETIDNADSEFLNIVEGLDESSFFELLEESNGTDDLTDDDLIAYVDANFTSYEIFENIEN
jgi:hypothetical protein